MRKLSLVFLLFSILTTARAQQHDLSYFLQQAFSNNPDIKNSDVLIQRIQFDSLRNRTIRKPQLNAHSRVWYAPLINGVGYDTLITNFGDYEATVQLEQHLFNSGYLQTTSLDLRYQQMNVKNDAQLARKELSKEITSIYISAYSDYDDWQFQEKVSQLYEEELTILHALAEKGLYRETDYLALRVNAQSQHASQQASLLQYKSDLSNLNSLCGIVDTSFIAVDSPGIHLNVYQPFSLSPFAFKFKIDSLQNLNKKSLVDLNYRPKLNLTADAGLISSTLNDIQHRFGTSVGLEFSIPIYDGRQRSLQYQQIDLDQQVISNEQTFVQRQYEQNVMALQQQLGETKNWISDLRKSSADIQSLIDVQKNELNSGQISVSDLVLTMNNLLQSRKQLRQAELKQLQLINELNYRSNEL